MVAQAIHEMHVLRQARACSHLRVKSSQSVMRKPRPYTLTVRPMRRSAGP
jgi:hypothetical protein